MEKTHNVSYLRGKYLYCLHVRPQIYWWQTSLPILRECHLNAENVFASLSTQPYRRPQRTQSLLRKYHTLLRQYMASISCGLWIWMWRNRGFIWLATQAYFLTIHMAYNSIDFGKSQHQHKIDRNSIAFIFISIPWIQRNSNLWKIVILPHCA